MLILSRKLYESVDVGNGMRITIQQLSKRHVRLGFEGPDRVVRTELHDRSGPSTGLQRDNPKRAG